LAVVRNACELGAVGRGQGPGRVDCIGRLSTGTWTAEVGVGLTKGDVVSVETDGTPIVIPCSRCATKTHHALLHSVDRSYSDEDHGIWFNDEYQIIECKGARRYPSATCT